MLKNRTIIITMFVSALIFAFNYGGKLPYILLNITIILPCASISYAITVYCLFKVTQEMDKKYVVKGDIVNYKCTISNESFILFPYIKAVFGGENNVFSEIINSKSFSLMPNEKLSISYDLTCKYRGQYELGLQYVEIVDFLGIFKIRYKPIGLLYININPRIVKLTNMKFKSNYPSESETCLGKAMGDGLTFSDIRKYNYGDSFRKIHWKSTAKYGEFMSKNYQFTSETSTLLVLDLKKYYSDNLRNIVIEDMILESALAVTYYCLSNWLSTSLLVYNNNYLYEINAKNLQEFAQVYQTISNIKFSEEFDLENEIEEFLRSRNSKSNIYIFSPDFSENIFRIITKVLATGSELNFVYINPQNFMDNSIEFNANKKEILKNLNQLEVMSYEINNCEKLNEIFSLF